jgi:hypothetical protein
MGSVSGLTHSMSIMISTMWSLDKFTALSLPIQGLGVVVLGCWLLEMFGKPI